MSGKRKTKAPAKALLLNAADEEEVDEPISNGNGKAVLLPMVDEVEEIDEPLPNDTASIPEKAEKVVLMAAEDEQDEVDEPILAVIPTSSEATSALAQRVCSAEYTEAITAIAADRWDISSWIIFYEEVQHGRSGETTIVDAYERIIAQFPRSARFWKNLAQYYLDNKDIDRAEETYHRSLYKCRSIDLWRSYLAHCTRLFVEATRFGLTDSYAAARAKCEKAFEDAVENVGLALGAYPIWKSYLDFVKSWPETGMIESGKKLHMLRNVYQQAVVVAMDQAEEIWAEYEAFEKQNNELASEAILAEFSRKYLHAKSIMKERKKLMANIVFDRLATPPTSSYSELQQLECWSHWISFEMSGPDYLNPESYGPMIRMVYDQCLCCFRYNPEIWLSLAQFEREVASRAADGTSIVAPDAAADDKAVASARAVYVEAIDANPSVMLLRSALAELEETSGKLETAKEVLRVTFEQNPCGFTFSLLQRFIRRNLGITAARRLFSETQAMRKTNPKVGLELYLANAKLELEVNCSPQVALNVLNMAQKHNAACLKDAYFVQAITRVLTLLGDVKQIRWIFQTALSEHSASADQTALLAAAAGKTASQNHRGGRSRQQANASSGAPGSHALLKAELGLWEEYLHAETVLGLSDVARLNELRSRRDKVKMAFEEAERVRTGVVFASKEEARAAQRGVFHPAADLSERYDSSSICTVWSLPEADKALQERCAYMITGLSSASAGGRRADRAERNAGGAGGAQRNPAIGESRDMLNMSTEFHLSLAGLPAILRDLLAKLPFHSGPLPDIDGFVRHVKSVILPPRPEPDDSAPAEGAELLRNGEGTEEGGEMGSATAPAWLGKHALDEADVDPEETDDVTLGAKGKSAAPMAPDEDVFRKRKRTRKAT